MGYSTGGLLMAKVILEVPEEVAEKLRAMEAQLKATLAAAREGGGAVGCGGHAGGGGRGSGRHGR